MSYQTLITACQANFEIKKSQFLAFAYPISHREQAMQYVENLKTQYPDARHHCWAYILGDPNNTTSAGFDDDGEPNGTAGRPILNVLQHKAIGDCIVIVVRYFGGIKLGAGGLTRAYSNATQAVINVMQLMPHIPKITLSIETDFAHEAFIRHCIQQLDGEILNVHYQKNVCLTVEMIQQQMDILREKIALYGKIIHKT